VKNKKYESALFFSIFIIVVVYLAVLFNGSDLKTGKTAMLKIPEITSIHEFISYAERYPEDFTLVVGSYATPNELQYGQEIADYLKIRLIYEDDVKDIQNLIIFGSDTTNTLLSKNLNKLDANNELIMTLSKNNLMIVVHDEEQAKESAKLIKGYQNNKEKLSPATFSVNFGYILPLSLGIILVSIISILFFVEVYRKKGLMVAQERLEEHKLEALKAYFNKYRQEGYTDEKISNWLINYGYDQSLVRQAEAKVNARANLPS
jgi:hypothetical protein